jgi:hypothetical protein
MCADLPGSRCPIGPRRVAKTIFCVICRDEPCLGERTFKPAFFFATEYATTEQVDAREFGATFNPFCLPSPRSLEETRNTISVRVRVAGFRTGKTAACGQEQSSEPLLRALALEVRC